MICRSSSLLRPVLTSTSTPRALKMSMAAGESWSEMRTRGGIGMALMKLLARLLGEDPNGKRGARPPPARGGGGKHLGRLQQLVGDGGEGPVEPGRQRFEVGGLHRAAAPDAQARRGVAIGGGVEGHAFLFQKVGELLGELRLAGGRERGDPAVDDLQADAGIGARLRIFGQ